MSRSLRTGLMWRFMVVATVPILALGFLVQDYLSRTRRESLEEKNELLCHVVARLLDHAMRGAEDELRQLAGFLETREMEDEAVTAVLDSAVARSPLFETVSLVDPEGRVRQIGLRDDRKRRRDQYLGLDLSRYPLLRGEPPINVVERLYSELEAACAE